MPATRSTGGNSDDTSKIENTTACDDLTKVKQSRSTQRGVATKLMKRMDELLQQAQDATDNLTAVQQLRGCYERFVDKIALLSRLDQQLLTLLPDDERSEEQDSCLCLMEELQEKLAEVKYVVQRPTLSSPPAVTGSATRVKLSKLDLPLFDGKYAKWTSFWDQFNASVDAEPSLVDSQKLNYLKRALRGEASKVISELSITDDNYAAARALLQARFENKRCIMRARFQSLHIYPALKMENAAGLRKLQTTMMEHIVALRNLGVNEDHLLVFLFAENLDQETREHWELHAPNEVSISELQKLDDLLTFLETRVRTLEVTTLKYI